MSDDSGRTEHLLSLRDALLDEMEEADRELGRVRMLVERLESDVRIGRPEPPTYADAKGHALPRAEQRVVDLYRDLTKLEDKLIAARAT